MILLDWLTLPLLLSSILCLLIKTCRLDKILQQHPLGRYWVVLIFIISSLLIGTLQHSRSVGLAMGLLSPSSLLLPILLASYLYTTSVPKSNPLNFKWYDVVFLSSLQLILILSSWTLLPWDIYRLGYLPYSALFALFLLLYAYIRKLDILALTSVLALVLWALDMGSNNYFDWIQHTFVLIIAWGWLLIQLLIRIRRKFNSH